MTYDPSAYVPGVGAGHAPSFMSAGRPFLTGSIVASSSQVTDGSLVQFPLITKNFTVKNIGDEDLVVHFKSRVDPNVMTNYHYWLLPTASAGELGQFTFNGKCREVYVSVFDEATADGEFLLYAELAAVNAGYNLTGSGIDE